MTVEDIATLARTKPLGLHIASREVRRDEDGWLHYETLGTLKYGDRHNGGQRRMRITYRQGMALKADPTAADVLAAYVDDAMSVDPEQSDGFEDWCSNLGMSSDSIKAKAMHSACEHARSRLQTLLGSDWDDFRQEYLR